MSQFRLSLLKRYGLTRFVSLNPKRRQPEKLPEVQDPLFVFVVPPNKTQMQHHEATSVLDTIPFMIPMLRPMLDATLRARRNRRGLHRRHWRFGISDYLQISRTCRSLRDSPFWHRAFQQMWREMRGDLKETLGITLLREPPPFYEAMPLVAKQQLAIDHRYSQHLRRSNWRPRTSREIRALRDLMT